jgi:hypothetical protein
MRSYRLLADSAGVFPTAPLCLAIVSELDGVFVFTLLVRAHFYCLSRLARYDGLAGILSCIDSAVNFNGVAQFVVR